MWNIPFCKSITPNYAIEYQSCIWCYIQLLPVVQNIFCVLEVPVKWLTTRAPKRYLKVTGSEMGLHHKLSVTGMKVKYR